MSGSRLDELLDRIEQDASLDDAGRLRERIELLNRLDELDALPSSARAEAARVRLERANDAVYQPIRDAIVRGDGAAALAPWLAASGSDDVGYDYLDDVVAGILRFDDVGATLVEPTPDMVFYQPTPARHVFDLFRRTSLGDGDVLVDLGAGIGHVPLLASIATPARAVGIEIEPAYVACARRAAESLGLERVTFVESDARDADLSAGTVFYLYTPFGGQMLRSMLDRLARESTARAIRVCSFGPCSATIARETWLRTTDVVDPQRIVVFQSVESA